MPTLLILCTRHESGVESLGFLTYDIGTWTEKLNFGLTHYEDLGLEKMEKRTYLANYEPYDGGFRDHHGYGKLHV